MARPRKASNILELKGAFKINPERRRPDRVKCKKPLANNPPKHLTAKQKAAWLEIYKKIPDGVVYESDEVLLEMTAVLLVSFREKGYKLPGGCLVRLSSCLDKLGMTPSGRESLKVEKQEEKTDDFE